MAETSKILIVDSPYYQDITDHLVSGAADALKDEGYAWDRISVPELWNSAPPNQIKISVYFTTVICTPRFISL